jgi:hypothetical protein
MKFNSFSISKMGDKLVKAMEAKELFENRPKKTEPDPYINRVKLLKETLTKEYKFCSTNTHHHEQYALRLITINKHIDYVRKIQDQKTFNKMDKEIIDKLIQKYGIDNQ